jgi:cobalt-zinc-cadmium efflux system outer membrane protein
MREELEAMIRLRTACLAGMLACAGLAPQPAAALDLEGALRDVAAANPTLAARRAMVEAAERRVAPAGAWQSPTVEAGVVNVPTTGRFDQDMMTMKMLGVTQRVPLSGSNGLSRRSAREAVTAEGAVVDLSGYELFGEAWEAYADAYYAGELARLAGSHRSVADQLVESARASYQSGKGRLDDVLRGEVERARTLVDLNTFTAEARSAQARLDALRGVAPGGRSDSLEAPPPAAPVGSPDAWLGAVGPAHPRLRELDARAGRYRFAARAARRTTWPDLELKGSYGWREPLDGVFPQDDMFSASVGIEVPLFASQRQQAEGAELDAMARATESERRAAELELRSRVVTAHAAARSAQGTVRLLADTVVTMERRAVDALWSAYRVGATDLWRIFDATHSLYGEEIALLRARQDLARGEGRLLALTGRGDLLGVALPAVKEAVR